MAQIRHLPNAPITEAVIDFRVEAPSGASVETLEGELDRRGTFGYRKVGQIIRGEFGFSINPQEQPPSRTLGGATTIIGVRLHSADEKYVALLTVEGFTLSRLQPYESWEALVAEATRVWQIYLDCLRPQQITRAATRFINNLRLPLAAGDPFERFLVVPPTVPEGLPQTVGEFLQRFLIYDAQSGATVIFTQALSGDSPKTPVPVILDIDVFRTARFPGDGSEAWGYLPQLRVLKNNFFFGCLTEEAIALYL